MGGKKKGLCSVYLFLKDIFGIFTFLFDSISRAIGNEKTCQKRVMTSRSPDGLKLRTL